MTERVLFVASSPQLPLLVLGLTGELVAPGGHDDAIVDEFATAMAELDQSSYDGLRIRERAMKFSMQKVFDHVL